MVDPALPPAPCSRQAPGAAAEYGTIPCEAPSDLQQMEKSTMNRMVSRGCLCGSHKDAALERLRPESPKSAAHSGLTEAPSDTVHRRIGQMFIEASEAGYQPWQDQARTDVKYAATMLFMVARRRSRSRRWRPCTTCGSWWRQVLCHGNSFSAVQRWRNL